MNGGSLGEFEHTVLVAIAHLADEAYGVTIRREIEARSGRATSIGALYTALDRLERKGYIRSAMSEPTAARGGRARRYVELTPPGAAALARARAHIDRMWAGLSTRRLLAIRRGRS